MALAASNLASSLQSSWLVAEGGEYPGSPSESGDRFAAAVSAWFASAAAGAFPCSTAAARKSQLAAGATAAFQGGQAPIAGLQLALALTAYMTGQVFGAGVAGPPAAMAAGQSAFVAAFGDLDAERSARANQIATGAYTMAISTIVIFPPVISPPLPVL